MKKNCHFNICTNPLTIIGLALILNYSCAKNKESNKQLPALSTADLSNIRSTSAKSGGTIISDGGDSIIAKGVCWNTEQNPTIEKGKTSNGLGTASYTSNLTSLSANTKYYVRAYAINSVGIAYGNDVTFTTLHA